MLFKNTDQATRIGHRMSVSTGRVRGRRARKPAVEALEGRALMASIQFLGAGAEFTDALSTSAQAVDLKITDLNSYQSQTLGSVYDSMATIGVDTPTDFGGPAFFHTFRIF